MHPHCSSNVSDQFIVEGCATWVPLVTTFKAHRGGLLQSVSTLMAKVEDAVAHMVVFMNSDACGPVVGVSLTANWPGPTFGTVLHGSVQFRTWKPRCSTFEGATSSNTWSAKAFHAKQPEMMVKGENAKGGFDKVPQATRTHQLLP